MKTIGLLGLFVFLLGTSVRAADPLDPLTGVYTGTLVREMSLTFDGTTPPNGVQFKQTTRVGGLGYIPAGKTRTTIKIILPAENVFNAGVDREVLMDFEQDPPMVQVFDGTHGVDLAAAFPTITVVGKVVTCTFVITTSVDGTTRLDRRTLKIMRKRP